MYIPNVHPYWELTFPKLPSRLHWNIAECVKTHFTTQIHHIPQFHHTNRSKLILRRKTKILWFREQFLCNWYTISDRPFVKIIRLPSKTTKTSFHALFRKSWSKYSVMQSDGNSLKISWHSLRGYIFWTNDLILILKLIWW